MSESTLRVVCILIRFSVLSARREWKLARGDFEQYRKELFDRKRLEHRFQLFESITLPSLAALTIPAGTQLRIIIATSAEMPAWARQRLQRAAQRLPGALLVEVNAEDPGMGKVLDEAMRREIGNAEGVVCASVRLDDDDALASGYLLALERFTRAEFAGCAVSFPRGYAAEIRVEEKIRIISLHHLYQPKIALGLAYINVWRGGGAGWAVAKRRNVHELGTHSAIDSVVPVLIVSNAAQYVRTIHGRNDDPMSGWHRRLPPVNAEAIVTDFGATLRGCVLPAAVTTTAMTESELFRRAHPYMAAKRMLKKSLEAAEAPRWQMRFRFLRFWR